MKSYAIPPYVGASLWPLNNLTHCINYQDINNKLFNKKEINR